MSHDHSLHSSAWAAITKHQRPGDIKDRNAYLAALEGGHDRTTLRESRFHWEASPPGL